MILDTKFDLGQVVFRIGRAQEEAVRIPCRFCRGRRTIRVESPAGTDYEFVSCPRCQGQGELGLARIPLFAFIGEALIGKISLEICDPTVPGWNGGLFATDGKTREERYMIDSTGFPSGTVYRDTEMFASRVEADREVERRNEDLLSGRSWKPDERQYAAAAAFLEHADVYEHEEKHVAMARQIVEAYEFTPADEE